MSTPRFYPNPFGDNPPQPDPNYDATKDPAYIESQQNIGEQAQDPATIEANKNQTADSPAVVSGPTQQYTFSSVTLKSSDKPDVLFDSGSLGNVRFDQHKIKLKVTAYHNGKAYDMTPYVMQIKTHMGLDSPSGKFTVLLTFQKRWDSLIDVQDYIEIYFARYLAEAPIIMRGLVSNVRRTRVADSSGKLHRAITINGENFGKIWTDYNIQYLVQEPGQSLEGIDTANYNSQILSWMLVENYGITLDSKQNISANDLMQGIVDKMLNAQLKGMQQVIPQIPLLIPKINVLSDYILNGIQINQLQGSVSVYSFVKQFGNAPWCEYFIDDFFDGPVLFYRNTPFKTQDYKLAFGESLPDPTYFLHPHISDADIIEEDVGTNDSEVYSYFFTQPALFMQEQTDPKATIISNEQLTAQQEADTQTIYNPHVDLQNLLRFGFKALQITSPAIPILDDNSYLALAQKMNTWLVQCFNWTQNMLNGTIRMKGNEHMRIGRYVTNDSTGEEFYIESVDHDLVISQTGSLGADNVFSFQTTIGVTRGRKVG